jgi:hypothetical protein
MIQKAFFVYKKSDGCAHTATVGIFYAFTQRLLKTTRRLVQSAYLLVLTDAIERGGVRFTALILNNINHEHH